MLRVVVGAPRNRSTPRERALARKFLAPWPAAKSPQSRVERGFPKGVERDGKAGDRAPAAPASSRSRDFEEGEG